MSKSLLIILFLQYSLFSHAGITAEDVLGEYWKDPLFGEAAESQTIHIEILQGRIWPEQISVPIDQTVRFVLINKSEETHLFAFTNNLAVLRAEPEFKRFIDDELYHAETAAKAPIHAHSHSGTSVDDAQAIVKLLEQRPTVLVKPEDKKEILIRFTKSELIELHCVIPAHYEKNLKGIIKVLANE